MDSHALTERQQKVLDFFAKFICDNLVAPTLRDVAIGLKFKTPSAVAGHVNALLKKGRLRQIGFAKSRAIVPVVEPGSCLFCTFKKPKK